MQADECGQLELLTAAKLKAPAASAQLPAGPCQLSFTPTAVGQHQAAISLNGEELPGSFPKSELTVVTQAGGVNPLGTFVLPPHLPTTVAAGWVLRLILIQCSLDVAPAALLLAVGIPSVWAARQVQSLLSSMSTQSSSLLGMLSAQSIGLACCLGRAQAAGAAQ